MAKKLGDFRVIELPNRPLPKRVDLRPWMSAVEDQEDIGSCSANAFAGVLEYLINRKYGKKIDVSRLFIYYNARRLQNQDRTIHDDGTTPYHSADALRKYGDCKEEYWPYDVKLVNQQPSQIAYDKAKKFTVVPVRMKFSMNTFKKFLAEGYPVILGVILLDSAGTQARQNSGRIERPDPSQTAVRNTRWHAVVCVGYDDESKHFILRNSWGKDWGLRGYFKLPYEYFNDNRLVDEGNGAWTIYDILPRSNHIPTMIFAKKVENKHHNDHHHRDGPSVHRRPTPKPSGFSLMLPYYNLYHRQ